MQQLALDIEARARAAANLAELHFSIANDAYGLVGFRQALVFAGDGDNSTLAAVSGLARPTEDSPYLIWLRRVWPWVLKRLDGKQGWCTMPHEGDDGVPAGLVEGWLEWWPAGVLALPLTSRAGQNIAWVVFLLEEPPSEEQFATLHRVSQTWGYCWEMQSAAPALSWKNRVKQFFKGKKLWFAIGIPVVLLIPIRQTALAPAEIVALDAMTISAPLDGVIKNIAIRPNSVVKKGQLLFSLDETTLRNRKEVAQQSVAVADAELMSATQKAFDSVQSKGDLALLNGRAYEKRAELASIQAQLKRVDVFAENDGVAVFGDSDDWLGRPVVTGERIMLLANPKNPGLLVHMAVADAINLEMGANVKMFLTVKPLSPMSAKIIETSYQAMLSPDNVASYRLRAKFEDATHEEARIGLRGTAKVYGGWVPLGYYVFRRPLASLREWSGW